MSRRADSTRPAGRTVTTPRQRTAVLNPPDTTAADEVTAYLAGLSGGYAPGEAPGLDGDPHGRLLRAYLTGAFDAPQEDP